MSDLTMKEDLSESLALFGFLVAGLFGLLHGCGVPIYNTIWLTVGITGLMVFIGGLIGRAEKGNVEKE